MVRMCEYKKSDREVPGRSKNVFEQKKVPT